MSDWQPIEMAKTNEGTSIIAFNGERVGEAVAYYEANESNDYEYSFTAWRWANDSCSCCWVDMSPQPILFTPMPSFPTSSEGE